MGGSCIGYYCTEFQRFILCKLIHLYETKIDRWGMHL